jgi:NCAIR mutase (PurE)-related protein
MAQCEVCGNDYYLSFEVVTAGVHHVFDTLSAQFRSSPPCVIIVAAGSSAMGSKRRGHSSAVLTAPARRG